MQAEGRAVVRAFSAALTPFDCRRTPVDGNVLLFAAAGPRQVDGAAMRRWLADWDARGVADFSLAALWRRRPRRARLSAPVTSAARSDWP